MRTVIYGLLDPRGGELRYVGKTVDLPRRISQHRRTPPSLRGHRADWIRSLHQRGVSFEVIVLDTVDGDGAAQEADLIQLLRHMGVRLTNLTDGGEGTPGVIRSPETREKLRQARLGSRASAETRAKMSAASKGRAKSATAKEHMRRGRLKLLEDPEVRERIRSSIVEANRRRFQNPENAVRLRESLLGHPVSVETRAKISQALRKYNAVKKGSKP